MGRPERRPPGRVQAGLGSPRTGRSVPPQRRTAEPPAEGRHRVPRQQASPRTSSTRRGSSASRCRRSRPSPQRLVGRVASGRRGPFFAGRHEPRQRLPPACASRVACGAALRGGSAALTPASPHAVAASPIASASSFDARRIVRASVLPLLLSSVTVTAITGSVTIPTPTMVTVNSDAECRSRCR